MDINWSDLIAMIGAITGVISLIKVHRLKVMDLRMEYGRQKNIIENALKDLKVLCEHANSSRIYRLAAQGKSKSGERVKWEKIYSDSTKEIEELQRQFKEIKDSTSTHLEKKNISLHAITERVNSLSSFLKEAVAADDKAREQIFQMKFNR